MLDRPTAIGPNIAVPPKYACVVVAFFFDHRPIPKDAAIIRPQKAKIKITLLVAIYFPSLIFFAFWQNSSQSS